MSPKVSVVRETQIRETISFLKVIWVDYLQAFQGDCGIPMT
jgi:hypothetical protein